MKELTVNLGERSYKITVSRGVLRRANEFFNLDRRVLVVTDTGVPKEYSRTVASCCKEARIITVPMGEVAKSLEYYSKLLSEMTAFNMTRSDCVVAVGGGVVGDLSGFAASSYMRGVDFYNIPTTLLSEVDSSIGGKVAINFEGVKNIVGTFYQPKGVLIDTEVLKTLPKRQIACGMAEAVKMALTSDAELFELIESAENLDDVIDDIIVRSLKIKKRVVEYDEREAGLRRVLNFGHTLGHAIEEADGMKNLFHGECVALGMLAVSSDAVKARLIPLLKRLGLPTEYKGDIDGALTFISHDKKCEGNSLTAVFVDRLGEYRLEKMSVSEFSHIAKDAFSADFSG